LLSSPDTGIAKQQETVLKRFVVTAIKVSEH